MRSLTLISFMRAEWDGGGAGGDFDVMAALFVLPCRRGCRIWLQDMVCVDV